jgi:hypothetical protein
MTPTFVRRFGPLAVALAVTPSCYLMCPYAPDQLVESTIRAECHFYFACCTAGEADILAAQGRFPDLSNFRDEDHCVRERMEEGNALNEIARGIVQAEQAGRFRYDYATAQGCAEGRINAMNNCNADFVLGDAAPVETPEVCEFVPGEGLVRDGQPCFFDFECAIPGSQCLPPVVLTEPEVCASDDDCGRDEICNERGFCEFDPGAIIIHDEKICIAPIPEGDPCDEDPDFPLLPPFCERGLRCIADGDGDEFCEQPRAEGDDCFSSDDCERGLFCDLSDGAPGECTLLRGEGDDCNNSTECEPGLFCDTGRNEPTCEAPLPVEVQICNGIQGGDDPAYDVPTE